MVDKLGIPEIGDEKPGTEHAEEALIEDVDFDDSSEEKIVSDGETEVIPAKERKKSRTRESRIKTGIKGLDELIEGGFEKNSNILVIGSTGTGKTIFGLQYLHEGIIKYNEPGLFISFEEKRQDLFRHALNFGWDFQKLESEGMFRLLEYKPRQVERLLEEGGGSVRDNIKAIGAKRIVIDSVTAYTLLFPNEYEKRENILNLFDLLKKWGCTTILISESPARVVDFKELSVGFLTDAIIALYHSMNKEKRERINACEIIKMRGTNHSRKMLELRFVENGLGVSSSSEVEVF